MPESAQFAEFVADIEPGLRRALAEEFGPEAGREATVDALAFAWANWDRVISAPDPEGYLAQVGQTAAERHITDVGDVTGDVTVILPPSQAGFDTVVAPVPPNEAMARADELAGGAAATSALPRTGAAASGTMAPTARLPLTPVPQGPASRRTGVWVAAAALVGVIALGGIAVAARSSDDGLDPVETTTLATLPTTVEVVTSLPRTLPPTTTLPLATAPPATAARVPDTLPEITAPDDDDGSDSDSDSEGTQAGDDGSDSDSGGDSGGDSGDTTATSRRRTTTTEGSSDATSETSAPVDSEPPTETSSDDGEGTDTSG